MEISYFFDSYAIIELIKGNPLYIKFNESAVVITMLNLVEVINSIYKDFGEEMARGVFMKFKDCVQDIDEEIIMESIKLKSKYKKRFLSYADCVGYAFAKNNNLRFLTGDKEFSDLDNVEYVK